MIVFSGAHGYSSEIERVKDAVPDGPQAGVVAEILEGDRGTDGTGGRNGQLKLGGGVPDLSGDAFGNGIDQDEPGAVCGRNGVVQGGGPGESDKDLTDGRPEVVVASCRGIRRLRQR